MVRLEAAISKIPSRTASGKLVVGAWIHGFANGLDRKASPGEATSAQASPLAPCRNAFSDEPEGRAGNRGTTSRITT